MQSCRVSSYLEHACEEDRHASRMPSQMQDSNIGKSFGKDRVSPCSKRVLRHPKFGDLRERRSFRLSIIAKVVIIVKGAQGTPCAASWAYASPCHVTGLYGAVPYVHRSNSCLSVCSALQSGSDHHQNPHSIVSPLSSISFRVSFSSPPAVLRARDDFPELPATPSTLL